MDVSSDRLNRIDLAEVVVRLGIGSVTRCGVKNESLWDNLRLVKGPDPQCPRTLLDSVYTSALYTVRVLIRMTHFYSYFFPKNRYWYQEVI